LSIPSLDAILTTHAHFDHSIDIGFVSSCFAKAGTASRPDPTYPPLFGCKSVANVALGSLAPEESAGLPKFNVYDRDLKFASLCQKYNIRVVNSSYSQSYNVGDFTVKFIEARHIKLPFPVRKDLNGIIEDPVIPEKDYYAYKQGEIHSLLIKHEHFGNILVAGSANYVPRQSGCLLAEDGPKAMVLGIGFLHTKDDIKQYRDNAIKPFKPEKVFFSHWDDLKTLLDEDMHWMAETNADEIYNAASSVCNNVSFLPLLECVKVL
jgi:hypothetical protein